MGVLSVDCTLQVLAVVHELRDYSDVESVRVRRLSQHTTERSLGGSQIDTARQPQGSQGVVRGRFLWGIMWVSVGREDIRGSHLYIPRETW
jgi:hypothetical protein